MTAKKTILLSFICVNGLLGIAAQAADPADSFSPSISLGKGTQPGIAVDKQSRLHLIYAAGGKVMYRLGNSNGVFGTPETALDIGSVWDPRVYLDANDVPHIISANGHYANKYTYYTNKIGGSWESKFVVFDKDVDNLNRATCPSLFIDGDKAYAGVFTVGYDGAPSSDPYGALALIENLAAPKRTAFLKINAWSPQIFVSGGKLMIGGRNKAKGDRRFTFQEHDKVSLVEKGAITFMSNGVVGELGRGNIAKDGDIMAAGATDAKQSATAGWYNSLSRVKSGKSAISYRTSHHNPCGQGFPVRDLVAKDRVYVFYWSSDATTPSEPTNCDSKVQLHFTRIENGSKASELNPVTTRSGGHGPAFRLTPAAAALTGGGALAVFSDCGGEMYSTIIGQTGPVLIRESNLSTPEIKFATKFFSLQGRSIQHQNPILLNLFRSELNNHE